MGDDDHTVWVDRGNAPVRTEGGISPGEWIALKSIDDGDERWTVCSAGPVHYKIATIENGIPGDTLETEALNAQFIATSPNMAHVLASLLDEFELRLKEQGDQSTEWYHVAVRMIRTVLSKAGY